MGKVSQLEPPPATLPPTLHGTGTNTAPSGSTSCCSRTHGLTALTRVWEWLHLAGECDGAAGGAENKHDWEFWVYLKTTCLTKGSESQALHLTTSGTTKHTLPELRHGCIKASWSFESHFRPINVEGFYCCTFFCLRGARTKVKFPNLAWFSLNSDWTPSTPAEIQTM